MSTTIPPMTSTRTAVTSVRCSAARLSRTWRIHRSLPIWIGSDRTRNGVPASETLRMSTPPARAAWNPLATGRSLTSSRGTSPNARPVGWIEIVVVPAPGPPACGRPTGPSSLSRKAQGARAVELDLVLDLAGAPGEALLAVGHQRAVNRHVEQEAERNQGGERRAAAPQGEAQARPSQERGVGRGAHGPQAHRSYAAAMR